MHHLIMISVMLIIASSQGTFIDRTLGETHLLEPYSKRNPAWEDLGWAWGKRASQIAEPKWDNLGWTWGKRSSELLPTRLSRTEMKNSPQWHDLGWSWGKKR